ncbi:MAG: DUF3168 domain-containing protein [Sphingomonas sp.]
MSAESVFHAAMLAALKAAPEFGGALNGVFEGPPVKGSEPYAQLGELLATDWSTKDALGRELLSAIIIRDKAESPVRAQALAGVADAVMRALAPNLAGFSIVSLVLIRSRLIRAVPGGWTAIVEHRARLLTQST